MTVSVLPRLRSSRGAWGFRPLHLRSGDLDAALPCGGLKEKLALRLWEQADEDDLPTVHTCTSEVHLPAYASREQLRVHSPERPAQAYSPERQRPEAGQADGEAEEGEGAGRQTRA